MARTRPYSRPIALLAALVLLLAANTYADEKKQEESDGTYTIKLVAADDEGEIIDEFALLQEEAMVESASRHKQEIGMSPAAISVITRDDIEASGAETITDLLRMVPGVDVVISSQFQTSISARLDWNDENFYFLVLIDGREANLELLGQTPMEAQPISLEDIERIEVIRGPASSLYGANALAGVISITTRAISKGTSGWVRLAGGEVGRMFAGARASTRLGSWGLSLSGGADVVGKFDNHRELGREVFKLRALAEYRWSEKRKLLFDAGFCQGEGMMSASVGMMHTVTQIRMLRLAYRSENIRAHLYWNQLPATVTMDAPLDFEGIHLAKFIPMHFDAHTVDLEAQWTLPEFYEPLMIIIGGTGRVSYLSSDQLLDAETYSDITSPDYHKPGIIHWQGRGAAFLHAEFAPVDCATVTGDLRYDYNSVTGDFISPRLAAIFRPAPGQFLRAGVTRAFRKPSFMETHAHLNVDFPNDSPITGAAREGFREFMTRGLGNPELENEELVSIEAGYLGQFLDKKLNVSLDIYYNRFTNMIGIDDEIEITSEGLPDIDRSSFLFQNKPKNDKAIIGSELVVRYSPVRNLSLLACWTLREVLVEKDSRDADRSPRNLLTLGVRFNTDSGLVGSLYAFSRSKFEAGGVPNPAGLLEKSGSGSARMNNLLLVLGKIGWKVSLSHGLALETGLKLFLPVSPFESPWFRYNEVGGYTTPMGVLYGGDLLRRMVTAYLQGSF